MAALAAILAAATVAGCAPTGDSSAESSTEPPAGPRITATPTSDLPGETTVTVTGTGFDTSKGIYVAFCVKPDPGQAPGPCGGGADTSGASGASQWISSNPPAYGKGLAVAYGPGGSFDVRVRIAPMIGDIDCRVTECGIATRADHTRSSDRSADQFVPVTFKEPA